MTILSIRFISVFDLFKLQNYKILVPYKHGNLKIFLKPAYFQIKVIRTNVANDEKIVSEGINCEGT